MQKHKEKINDKCTRCKKECKQSASVKIVKCPLFVEQRNKYIGGTK